MRFFIVIIAILMVPAFSVLLEWRFQWGQRDEILTLCRARLKKAGLTNVAVTLDHFDATLTGTCLDPEDRDKAQKLVKSVRGVRVKGDDNQIRVPAKITATIEGHELRLSGWLATDGQRSEVVKLMQAARPDLEVRDAGVRTSAHVVLPPDAKIQEGSLPTVYASLMESVRLPALLSITGDGQRYVFKGSLPSKALRDEIIAAARTSAPGIEIDASQFIAQEHVASAPFAEGHGLADFVKVFFDSPAPGTFQIDMRNGPRLKAYATTAMESAWLTALRPVSGGTKVTAEITRLPSIYHFPSYRPKSITDRRVIDALRTTFREAVVLFDSGSSKIKAPEDAKLPVLADAIKTAGPGLRLVVAGYADVGGEPGSTSKTVQRARAEAVRGKLVELGVEAEELEAVPFDAVPPPGTLTDENRRETRCVELLIK